LPKQRQVYFQSREEHQQQHAQLGEELRNRVLGRKNAEHVGPEHHAAQQQPYCPRQADAARESRNDDDQHHDDRSSRQHRKRCDRLMKVFKDRHDRFPESIYFGIAGLLIRRLLKKINKELSIVAVPRTAPTGAIFRSAVSEKA